MVTLSYTRTICKSLFEILKEFQPCVWDVTEQMNLSARHPISLNQTVGPSIDAIVSQAFRLLVPTAMTNLAVYYVRRVLIRSLNM